MARCDNCGRSTGHITFFCSCKKTLCINCRYAEVHNCTRDYKDEGRKRIMIENPKIESEKIKKI